MNTVVSAMQRSISTLRTQCTVALVLALAIVCGISGNPVYATDYPDWDDVVAARSSAAAQDAAVANLKNLIAQLQSDVSAAENSAQQRWSENAAAQDALEQGKFTANQLRFQAEEAEKKSEKSRGQAAALTAQFVRSAGNDLNTQLLISGEESADLLYRLSTSSKLSETTKAIYAQAQQDSNTAASLSEQAEVAEKALETLAATAAASLNAAISTQKTVQAALLEQEAHEAQMTMLLKVLTENLQITEQQYNEGVAAERQRQVEAEQAAAREAAARRANAGSGGTGATPRPPAGDAPPQEYNGEAIVAFAEQFVGKVAYGYAPAPEQFMCDNLVGYTYANVAGIQMPRLVSRITAMGTRISSADARAGDLVVWERAHIGIFDGNGGIIHAPDFGRLVEHSPSLWGDYFFIRIVQ